jgi:hypothetical protein
MRLAVFYPFLYDDKGQVPEQDSVVYRVASFVGSIGSDQLVPGPLLDTEEFKDVHELLTLVGLKFDEMQQIQLNDGQARHFGSVAFDTVLSITPEIVFALNEAAARAFLLDLRSAVGFLKNICENDRDACLIEIIFPQSA